MYILFMVMHYLHPGCNGSNLYVTSNLEFVV
jgi:hypothetical protein